MSKTNEIKSGARYSVQAVDRAIDILETFTHQDPYLSLGQVAERSKLSKPTTYRLLATMARRGLIDQRADNGAYCLGSEIAALAAIRMRQNNLLDYAMPVIRKIRDLLNDTVALAIRVGDYRVHVYQLEGLHPLRRGAHSGERSPLYAGASNKLLLAAMQDPEISDYLARTQLVPFTSKTIVDKERLWAEIRDIRERGYAESSEEKYVGGVSLAAPIRDATGTVVAALYASIPKQRYDDEYRSRCIEALINGSMNISRELGDRG
jgi:DNA-binding IclR family transcriptional regulator